MTASCGRPKDERDRDAGVSKSARKWKDRSQGMGRPLVSRSIAPKTMMLAGANACKMRAGRSERLTRLGAIEYAIRFCDQFSGGASAEVGGGGSAAESSAALLSAGEGRSERSARGGNRTAPAGTDAGAALGVVVGAPWAGGPPLAGAVAVGGAGGATGIAPVGARSRAAGGGSVTNPADGAEALPAPALLKRRSNSASRCSSLASRCSSKSTRRLIELDWPA